MKYILDTNIFISLIRNEGFSDNFDRKFRKRNDIWFTSTVVEGELNSFAIQRNWGQKRLLEIKKLLNKVIISPIKTQKIIQLYAEIDAYSQGKHPTLKLPKSARNMGKNDICLPRNLGGIAATAAALELTLITTDRDFDHLDGVFLDVVFVNIREF